MMALMVGLPIVHAPIFDIMVGPRIFVSAILCTRSPLTLPARRYAWVVFTFFIMSHRINRGHRRDQPSRRWTSSLTRNKRFAPKYASTLLEFKPNPNRSLVPEFERRCDDKSWAEQSRPLGVDP